MPQKFTWLYVNHIHTSRMGLYAHSSHENLATTLLWHNDNMAQ